MFNVEHFAHMIASFVRKVFPVKSDTYDELSCDEITLVYDLDGKDLREWLNLIKCHKEIHQKADELRNLILKTNAMREVYWRTMLEKYKSIFDATNKGFSIGIRKDSGGKIVFARSILPDAVEEDDENE